MSQQQYHVVLMGLELVGSDWGLGRRASWAVHDIYTQFSSNGRENKTLNVFSPALR